MVLDTGSEVSLDADNLQEQQDKLINTTISQVRLINASEYEIALLKSTLKYKTVFFYCFTCLAICSSVILALIALHREFTASGESLQRTTGCVLESVS